MLKKRSVLALVALAAGALLAYEAGPRLPGTTAAAPAAQDREEVISFEVLVPTDATLEIDAIKTKESGPVRHFQTPPLPVGREYTYTVRATHKGQEVTLRLAPQARRRQFARPPTQLSDRCPGADDRCRQTGTAGRCAGIGTIPERRHRGSGHSEER